jgi:RNA polymerase sigma-70 factor (ECF subfamily)
MDASGRSDTQQWVLDAVERYELPLLRFAARLMRDEHAARDVVQHVFLSLCGQSLGSLQDRLNQWLFAVCRNKALDMLRQRENTTMLREAEFPEAAAREGDPAATAERADLYRSLYRLVEQLPLPQREAVALWSEGFSYREIAEIGGTNEGNVRVVVHRALKHLREHPAARQLLGDDRGSRAAAIRPVCENRFSK